MKNNFYIYEVTAYSSESLLLKIKQNKLHILEFKKIDEFVYHITIDVINNLQFKKVFPNARIVKTSGLFFIIKNRLIQKVTIISLICGIAFYIFLSTLLFRININGNNSRISNEIRLILEQNEIRTLKKIPDKNLLEKIKNQIMNDFYEIENVDCSMKGTILNITYYLKEKENHHYQELGKYYAKKTGMIKYVDIERGNFLYSTNQYVKEGALLIDDYLYLNNNSIYIGAYGKVYANTWSTVSLKIDSFGFEKAEAYAYLTNQARYNISKTFTSDEKIENESILNFIFNETFAEIKIHYTLLENIAILQKN